MYQLGKKTSRPKDRRVFLKTAFVFGVALIAAAWILHKDLTSTTDERTTVPIITEVAGAKDEVILINEPAFVMELPADWKQTNRVTENYANFYEWRSTKKGANDRRLQLHIDIMPKSYKLVRMQPLTASGNKFILGNISGNCMDFATKTGEERSSNAPVEAKWEGVRFICDPINANQTIGTGTVEGGITAKLGGHTFYFYFEDHNIRPDDKILQNALSSFRAK